MAAENFNISHFLILTTHYFLHFWPREKSNQDWWYLTKTNDFVLSISKQACPSLNGWLNRERIIVAILRRFGKLNFTSLGNLRRRSRRLLWHSPPLPIAKIFCSFWRPPKWTRVPKYTRITLTLMSFSTLVSSGCCQSRGPAKVPSAPENLVRFFPPRLNILIEPKKLLGQISMTKFHRQNFSGKILGWN